MGFWSFLFGKKVKEETAPKPIKAREDGSKVLLIVLDGWGIAADEKGNAPFLAQTPTLDYIYSTYPKTLITASGIEVGIAPGEPGNSEVGHSNIGSGRVVWENLPKLNKMAKDGSLATNRIIQGVWANVGQCRGATVHLIGLVSDGGVHAHIDHVTKLLELAAQAKVCDVCVHFISDGRDTPPEKALDFVHQLEGAFKKFGVGRIATVIGRYFAMDRDNNWDRTQKAIDLWAKNEGEKCDDIREGIKKQYAAKKNDEFLEPIVIGEGGKIKDGDAIIFFNYRSDRARQMLAPFDPYQTKIDVPEDLKRRFKDLYLCTLTQYYSDTKVPVVAQPTPEDSRNPLGGMVAQAGLRQFHTAETEKFAHVTYFLNSGEEKPFTNELDEIVSSKKVKTYDLAPEMSALEVTEKVLAGLQGQYHFVVVNYANGDMVGHTGVLDAAVKACEIVDSCLNKILQAAQEAGYKVILTADHGNCDVMIDAKTGKPHKEHTTNPVPFIYFDFQKVPFAPRAMEPAAAKKAYVEFAALPPIGVLADISPSVLALMGIDKPQDMSGMDITTAL